MALGAARKLKTKPTRAEQVLRQLASEIVLGTHGPGDRLDEVAQSQRMKVSRTPLREALRQLAAVGLVESVPHCGVVVSSGGRSALLQMLEEIEVICVRWLCQRQVQLSPSRDGIIWSSLHSHCGNSVLVGVAETLWQPIMVMSGSQRPWIENPQLRDAENALCQAIAKGNCDLAEHLVRQHVRLFSDLILSFVQKMANGGGA